MSKRKVLIVLGSPRKQGNTAALAEEVTAGALAAGAEVESIYLHGMKIQPCAACGACKAEGAHGCVIDDDMKLLYPKILQADAVTIASPIYWWNVSAQTKLFLDRCSALDDSEGNGLARKQIGIVLAYGGADPFISGAVNAIRAFQDAFGYFGTDVAGIVYGSAMHPGQIRENRGVMEKAYRLGQRLGSGQ